MLITFAEAVYSVISSGTRPPQLVVLLITFVIGIVITFFGYAKIPVAFHYRFNPEAATAVWAQRVHTQGEPPTGDEILIDDPALLDGLKELSSAEVYWVAHEHFTDGYRLRIRVTGA